MDDRVALSARADSASPRPGRGRVASPPEGRMRMAPAGLRQPHGSLLLRGSPDPVAWGPGPQRVRALALPESEGSPMLGWTATGVLRIDELEREVSRLRRAPRTRAWDSEPRSHPPTPLPSDPHPAPPASHHQWSVCPSGRSPGRVRPGGAG